jgi:hypothetical protein
MREVIQRDSGSLSREPPHDARADAKRAASDDRDLTL